MNAVLGFNRENGCPPPENVDLQLESMKSFAASSERIVRLRAAIETIRKQASPILAESLKKLLKELDIFEPSVTMIGQVKAGKTSLVNAMIGRPDFLPADVNPWTSVVTSVHLGKSVLPDGTAAVFRFFESAEWDWLTESGGRIGELAGRAGAENEFETVKQQLAEMREKSKRRLGTRFELLMGQEHRYRHLDPALVKRYVCLGDDFGCDLEPSDAEGQFADITKSADLHLPCPGLPLNLCIRDTPGVNDTFLMREQVTISAISDSRACVVVLSAHQAMSTVDLAMLRLIANVPARSVIIFVNRIDELSDPLTQIPEIRSSILRTIKQHRGPESAKIIFGSAYWANNVLEGRHIEIDSASADALINWAESQDAWTIEDKEADSVDKIVWNLSGIPALLNEISTIVERTEVTDQVKRISGKAINLGRSVESEIGGVSLRKAGAATRKIPIEDIPFEFRQIHARCSRNLQLCLQSATQDFVERMARSQGGFIHRSTSSLLEHLQEHGELSNWECDPSGLRVVLRSALGAFLTKSSSLANEVFQTAVSDIGNLYFQAFDVQEDFLQLEPPIVPNLRPPVFLGKTIVIDMNAGWWRRWWMRRRGFRAITSQFSQLVQAETSPILEQLKVECGDKFISGATQSLDEFFSEQRSFLRILTERVTKSAGKRQEATSTSFDLKGVQEAVREIVLVSRPLVQ